MKPSPAFVILLALLSGCGQGGGDQERLKAMDGWRKAQAEGLPQDLDARWPRADAAKGAQLYAQHCLACHGAGGAGDGSAGAGLRPKPADLRAEIRQSTTADIFSDISHGVSGSAMVAWQGSLSEEEIVQIIAHLHHLAGKP